MIDSIPLHSPIVKQATIAAPRALVWHAVTDQRELATWFGRDARVELRVGGPYEILFLMDNPPGLQGREGNTVLSFEPEQFLEFSWNAPPDFGRLRDIRTRARIELEEAESSAGTAVTLTHDKWGPEPEWAAVRTYFDRAWDHVISDLNSHFSLS